MGQGCHNRPLRARPEHSRPMHPAMHAQHPLLPCSHTPQKVLLSQPKSTIMGSHLLFTFKGFSSSKASRCGCGVWRYTRCEDVVSAAQSHCVLLVRFGSYVRSRGDLCVLMAVGGGCGWRSRVEVEGGGCLVLGVPQTNRQWGRHRSSSTSSASPSCLVLGHLASSDAEAGYQSTGPFKPDAEAGTMGMDLDPHSLPQAKLATSNSPSRSRHLLPHDLLPPHTTRPSLLIVPISHRFTRRLCSLGSAERGARLGLCSLL